MDEYINLIEEFALTEDLTSQGLVISVGDGIVLASGLEDVLSNELVILNNEMYGLAMNLQTENVGIILFGNDRLIGIGDTVEKTNDIVSIPICTSENENEVNYLGRIVDSLGSVDFGNYRALIDVKAPGIISRESVRQSLFTGIKAVDSMIPIGKKKFLNNILSRKMRLNEVFFSQTRFLSINRDQKELLLAKFSKNLEQFLFSMGNLIYFKWTIVVPKTDNIEFIYEGPNLYMEVKNIGLAIALDILFFAKVPNIVFMCLGEELIDEKTRRFTVVLALHNDREEVMCYPEKKYKSFISLFTASLFLENFTDGLVFKKRFRIFPFQGDGDIVFNPYFKLKNHFCTGSYYSGFDVTSNFVAKFKPVVYDLNTKTLVASLFLDLINFKKNQSLISFRFVWNKSFSPTEFGCKNTLFEKSSFGKQMIVSQAQKEGLTEEAIKEKIAFNSLEDIQNDIKELDAVFGTSGKFFYDSVCVSSNWKKVKKRTWIKDQ